MPSGTGGGGRRGAGWVLRVLLWISLAGIPIAGIEAADPVEEWPFRGAPRDAEGRFENLVPWERRVGPLDGIPFLLRRLAGRFGTPVGLPERVTPDLESLRSPAGNPSVTWVGHSTLLVRMGGVSFLTDPIWADRAAPRGLGGARRYLRAGIEIEDLPPIDFVVISHNHYDHLDLPTLRRLAADHPKAHFLVPLANGELLRREGIETVTELDWGQRHERGEVTIICLPSQHWSRRGLFDERRALWSSWAIVTPQRRFYFAGDTAWFPGFRTIGEALGPFDLAALPIGAYQPQVIMRPSHLDPEQAVQAGLDLSARRILGIHYGTFDLSDEPAGEPPLRFRAAAQRAGFADEDSWVLRIGETRRF